MGTGGRLRDRVCDSRRRYRLRRLAAGPRRERQRGEPERPDVEVSGSPPAVAGLIFATRGSIERVTNKVFLLSPANVTVAAEDKQKIADRDFFNQS